MTLWGKGLLMIAVDTNVIIRYLLNDDVRQAAKAAKLIEHAAAEGDQVFVSTITLAETIWVLQSAYDFFATRDMFGR
jgi:predicted nucleic-acid-binding protein